MSNPLTAPPLPPPAVTPGSPMATPGAPTTPSHPPAAGRGPWGAGGLASTKFAPAAPPPPPTPQPGGNFMTSFAGSGLGRGLADFHNYLTRPPQPAPAAGGRPAPAAAPQAPAGGLGGLLGGLEAHVRDNVPPLVAMGAVGPDSPLAPILGGAQRMFRDNPQTFASVVGGVGAPLVKPILGTPLGLPAMAGMYGLTAGGRSGEAMQTYFKPLLDRLK